MTRDALSIFLHAVGSIALVMMAISLTGCFETHATGGGESSGTEGAGTEGAGKEGDYVGYDGKPCATTTPSAGNNDDMDSFFFEPAPQAKAAIAHHETLSKTGMCPIHGNSWGKFGDCLATQRDFRDYRWHCPWESMLAMSTADWGGCKGIKIDCEQTQYQTILDLYKKHMTKDNPPPEGNLQTVSYAHCCVTHYCKNGPICKHPPWSKEKQAHAKKTGKNPCGPQGCERLYDTSMLRPWQLTGVRNSWVLALAAIAAATGLLCTMLLLWGIRVRARSYCPLAFHDVESSELATSDAVAVI